jgi:hypothetical protein
MVDLRRIVPAQGSTGPLLRVVNYARFLGSTARSAQHRVSAQCAMLPRRRSVPKPLATDVNRLVGIAGESRVPAIGEALAKCRARLHAVPASFL